MDELVRWLGQQLDEDERDAEARRGIFPSPGVRDDGAVALHIRPGGNMAITWYRNPAEGWDDMAKLRGWADTKNGWTQERVLREIDAKRKLVKMHGQAVLRAGGGAQYFDTATVCRSCEPNYPVPRTVVALRHAAPARPPLRGPARLPGKVATVALTRVCAPLAAGRPRGRRP